MRRLAPSLLFAALLAAAGCTTTGQSGPPAPISSGGPRAEPGPAREVARRKSDGLDNKTEIAKAGVEPGGVLRATDDGLTPPHMIGREIKRAAVLLPFNHPSAAVRREAEAMLAAVELALFDHAEDDFLLLPKDTGGTQSGAMAAAEAALDEGADVILGPLFAANVRTVGDLARRKNVPVIGFSNDRSAAQPGTYLATVPPEEEVAHVIDYALRTGIDTFAFLGPRSDFGRRIEAALRFQVVSNGGQIIASAFYDPSNDAPVDEAKIVAEAVKFASETAPGRVAVLIPERGVKLRAVAPLLPYYGVDTRRIRMLGVSAWNDESIWREPTLIGGWFADVSPDDLADFEASFQRNYGRAPTTLAGVAYDATALGIALARDGELTPAGLTDPGGFRGVNGLFRFLPSGSAERSLAILEITQDEGAQVVEPAAGAFTPTVG